MKIKVTYEETLAREVEIEVDPTQDIEQQAREYYKAERVVLNHNDLQVALFLTERDDIINDWETI